MLEASTDLAFYDTMISANTNWSVCGFKESLQYTIKFLRKSGICKIRSIVISSNAGESSAGGPSAAEPKAGGSSAGKSSTGESSGGESSAGKSKNDEPEDDDDKPTGSEAGGAGADGAGAGEATGGAMIDPTIELRSVSHSLKAIIHPRFDYGVFLGVITDFQANCHSCIRGLSKAVGMLVDLVLAGQHATQKKMSFFDIKAVDLFDCGLSKSVKPIAIIDDISASVQELFVSSGFWKILSFCIGRKNEDKTKIPLLTRIQEDLERTDYVDFTTRSALQEACIIYHTNFSNIYSKRNCQTVLKTVINLVIKKKPESKEPAAATTTGAPSPVSRKGKLRLSATSSPQPLSTTDAEQAIELLDSDGGDLESVMDDELQEEEENRDLAAKEINALTSISVMLCQSPLHQSAIDCCCTIINAIKSLVPKEDFPPPYKWFGLFQLCNILVTFHPGITRKNAKSFFPTIEDTPSQKMAIALNPVTLYLLFSKQYHIYQKDKSAFTSNSMIKSIETKEDIFSNFFDVPKIKKILKEQKLDFKHYIKFKDQYNVHLVGSRVKKHNNGSNGSKSGEDRSNASESSVNRSSASKSDVDKVKKLSSDIKETKKQLSSLSRQLSKLQRHRMDCGNESHSWEKKHNNMNFELCKKLKDARSDYDELYMKVSSLKSSIKRMSSEMYMLNKRIHGQQVHQAAADAIPKPLAVDSNTIVQGTDPGVVTTASSVWCSSLTVFESINRFQMLQDYSDTATSLGNEETFVNYEMTANKVDNAVLSNRRKKRKKSSVKKLLKGRATGRIRLKKLHQHLVASEARSAATMSTFNKPKMVSFIGNWHRNTQYLHGHSTRSMKPYMSTLSTRSTVRLVDEYNFTKICCSCFKETQKQLVGDEDNRMKRNLGAVTYFNPECPKRLAKQTTMNRDEQGASNIALIGLSALVSLNNKVLPPFSRVQNPDK
ncbi:40S ribosomal protein S27 [Mucor velutinosus]|uniref:40S ribosomal protein S27 n=1 Tax=Mucor velutinosus TaxID=708070 RepID=A0AAN7DEN0_9FUNG|nr:40S ribosomal protein S27 [Mucor velutinosus]